MRERHDIAIKSQAIALYNKGIDYKDIAKQVKIPKTTVYGWIKDYRDSTRMVTHSEERDILDFFSVPIPDDNKKQDIKIIPQPKVIKEKKPISYTQIALPEETLPEKKIAKEVDKKIILVCSEDINSILGILKGLTDG